MIGSQTFLAKGEWRRSIGWALVCGGWLVLSQVATAAPDGTQAAVAATATSVPAACPTASAAGLAQDDVVRIATFDSGFGGFFTAKSIEETSHALSQQYRAQFCISHYGDTVNAPYGEKTPEQIAQFAAQGIYRAFADGAQEVFIACNTASTQYDRIKQLLDAKQPGLSEKTVSIIDSSVAELKRQIDERLKKRGTVRVAIFATPATVKLQTYPKALARAYGVELMEPEVSTFRQPRWYKVKGREVESVNFSAALELPDGRAIEIYQIGPANWVDMIEHAAPAEVQNQAVQSDMKLLTSAWNKTGDDFTVDVVGEFCTHYPVFDARIREQALAQGFSNADTTYIKQGPLMAGIFNDMMQRRLASKTRAKPPAADEAAWLTDYSRPRIFISGDNVQETQGLAQAIFAQDPAPVVVKIPFAADAK